MDNILNDIEPDVKHMNNETLLRGEGGGGHTGYEGAWRHCKTNSTLLAIYIST